MDYIFSVRRVRQNAFDNEPGSTYFLAVPGTADDLLPNQAMGRPGQMPKTWRNAVMDDACPNHSGHGEIVFYVHGFNTTTQNTLARHRLIKNGLRRQGFKGTVVSFDWPAADKALNYLEDRTDAKETARRLVDDGIRVFAQMQTPECGINLHIMAHSMGCYVVREAFDDADDRRSIASTNWSVSQMLFVSADVSAASMAAENPKSASLYRHCMRLTNYANPYDGILSLSDVKRIGAAPRAGRVGLPQNAPQKAVNVDVGAYYDENRVQFQDLEFPAHSWYFYDETFMRDAFCTITGEIDRNAIPTRTGIRNSLILEK
ncbi:alpha/beta hydrolase [Parasulfitobacter algicola]|uniref:Alpha/beta hydrolase n=1 Tax=Parasulfitobacter algicola TaxID=2614809 RepID=A0ABX2IVJ6_9RHOB|nr:alpha/beta hydrolase [Sulfitobacter algicola]NSX54068.1 alpha/beta hydrolase [Sulfitobacter algicola]